jgi:hypothetical protein
MNFLLSNLEEKLYPRHFAYPSYIDLAGVSISLSFQDIEVL